MVHAYHEGLPDYVEGAVFQDGCEECEHRAAHLSIGHMDPNTWARCRSRALKLQLGTLDKVSQSELKLLRVVGDVLMKERAYIVVPEEHVDV